MAPCGQRLLHQEPETRAPEENTMSQKEIVLNVAGMSCSSCVRHVSAALQSVPGVSNVEVRLRAGTVLVRHDATASTSSMVKALGEAGYDSQLAARPASRST